MERIFGDVGIFAIHIKQSSLPLQFYFNYYFGGKPLGSFKTKGYLFLEVNEFFKFINHCDELFIEKYSSMSDLAVFSEIINFEFLDSAKYSLEEQKEYMDWSEKFILRSDKLKHISVLVFREKLDLVFIIYDMNIKGKPRCYRQKVLYSLVINVYKEFADFCINNNLLHKMPTGRPVRD